MSKIIFFYWHTHKRSDELCKMAGKITVSDVNIKQIKHRLYQVTRFDSQWILFLCWWLCWRLISSSIVYFHALLKKIFRRVYYFAALLSMIYLLRDCVTTVLTFLTWHEYFGVEITVIELLGRFLF